MKFRSVLVTILFILIVPVLLPKEATTTVVKKLSDEELTLQAQNILIGTCTSIRSEWNEAGTKIFTYVTVSLQSSLKGDQNQGEIVIRQLGGEVGEVGMLVEGTTAFEEGEQVLLFLKKGRKRFHRVLGLYQGKFSIDHDATSGRKVLSRKKVRIRRRLDGRLQRRVVKVESENKPFLDEYQNKIKSFLRRNQ